MRLIEGLGSRKAETDAVQGERIVSVQGAEQCGQRTALGEVIFGVRFEPAASGPVFQPVGVMHAPQADAGSARGRAGTPATRHQPPGVRLPPTMRSQVPLGREIHSFLSPSTLA